MNARNLFLILLTSSFAVACGDSSVEDDQPADPKNGLETLDDKDDSFAVRPGSPEAQAVVDYLNQPLADDAAGEAFRVELDSVLYRRAADNIAAYRAGDDETFGTSDDLQFDSISQVDMIPYVGRSSLMRLFEVAEAKGYFQRASVDCADYLAHDRWNNYRVDSYADLLEVENSRCTTINGNLNIHIRGTDLLPPSARAVDHLRHLVTVDGDVTITTTEVFESMHFDSLETITGTLTARGLGEHALEFDALTGVESIHLDEIETAIFPSLEHNDSINLTDSDYTGFTALGTVGDIKMRQRDSGTFPVDFPELVEARKIEIEVERPRRWSAPDVTFEGGFSALETVFSLNIREGKYAPFEWSSLVSVENIHTANTFDVFTGMDALESVDTLVSDNDHNTGGAHTGPANLITARSISVTTAQDVDGYPALTTVEKSISITTDRGVRGFESVETVDSRVTLNIGIGREPIEFSGFNAATVVGGISINANNTSVTVGDLFTNLEFSDASLSILRNTGFSANPVFPSLLGISGGLRIDSLQSGENLMPELEIVDGGVELNSTPGVLTGFDKLEHIEGTLTIKRHVETIDGFTTLNSIGRNLSVPRTLDETELDDFLNQLEEFSGTINFN